MKLAFVDCETTGLTPDVHELWEVAVITRDDDGAEHEVVWELPVAIINADPTALRIGGYWQRATLPFNAQYARSRNNVTRTVSAVAVEVAGLLAGAHIVGVVPAFDAAFLRRWLRRHRLVESWHYHLVTVEAMAAATLGMQPPWNSEELSLALGVDPTDYERHTALGDARWAQALYDAVFDL